MNLFGLLGFPLGHSFSKTYFTEKFKAEGINAEFVNFEFEDIRQMQQIINSTPDLKGFAVTIPYKEKIIPLLDHISEEAKAIGAVNSVKVEHTPSGPALTGYNTDVLGFKESLLQFIPRIPEQALLLGTGGASKAVRHALESLGITVITVSRTPRTLSDISYDQIPRYISRSHLIVNATPVGTWPHVTDCPDIPYDLLTPEHYLFDLVYNPAVTEFMKRAQQQGAQTRNGLQMLQLQADHSWQLWTKN
ncbi:MULTISPECIES: shikimate dehydrogenase family protein [Odoribacteraceae]|uniref:shikimate dehydrogenase family protein n=1 Tax=Odoribacteraceae TaxID=1853231 RepID=UPI000E538C4A|nr:MULTISPECIES: shikimate dehydrogenase [Odoribacteraceae]MCQ4874745.1 shikimate dehydrogenase [Butyricimonas paravirosa]RHR80497.1 shikimate dehydrogenase [Odoribacter sp. AF15-53]